MDLEEALLKPSDRTAKICSAGLTVLLGLVVLVLVLTFITTASYTLCVVSGSSMNPTLTDGQYVLVEKHSGIADVRKGDIVICTKTLRNRRGEWEETQIIKRAVAVGGDVVRFLPTSDGNVELWVNGERKDEPYTKEPMLSSGSFVAGEDIEVPNGALFVLGDNRNDSTDSRDPSVGFVVEKEFGGRVGRIVPQGSLEKSYLALVYGMGLKGGAAIGEN